MLDKTFSESSVVRKRSDRRSAERMKIRCAVDIENGVGHLSAHSEDIGPCGMSLVCSHDIPENTCLDVHLSMPQDKISVAGIKINKIKCQVTRKEFLENKIQYKYGLKFLDGRTEKLADALDVMVQDEVCDFFELKVPEHLKEELKGRCVSKKADQREIMQSIDFTPPFLRTQKIVLFGDGMDVTRNYSLGMGVISAKDTFGHYNKTIYLAMCGWLMASTASAHLALLYPNTAPQVTKADEVMPLPLPSDQKGLWQPSEEGTVFFVTTKMIIKKMILTQVETRISFDKILYGTIRKLQIILTPKQSIWSARALPSCSKK